MTYEQQLYKLSCEKNLVIENEQYAEEMLRQIGYFTLISGYKELYVNPTTRKFKDGTTFEEIVALYRFDESLRELFLKYLLIVEQNIRSQVSYNFTQHYGENQIHYLSEGSFNNIPKNINGVKKLINMLKDMAMTSKDTEYIVYHRTKYGNVPLWLLVKMLTFGSISHFYQYLPNSLQAKISKTFRSVNEQDLMRFLRVLTKFRNVCAHNERLFSYRLRKEDIPDTSIHRKLQIAKKGNQYLFGKRDLFCVVISLRYLLRNDDFILFKAKLGRIISSFLANTNHVSDGELLVKMGFPENWKKITAYRLQ
jgi:abortive infection bacteriophage resistance protein